MPIYSNKDCVRFIRDMEEANIPLYHLNQKHWQGPCVTVDNPEKVLENTRVKCCIIQEGTVTVIHPIVNDEGDVKEIKAVIANEEVLEQVNFEDEELENL